MVSAQDIVNQVIALQSQNDEKLEKIFSSIDETTQVLYDENVRDDKKYDVIVSIEYLLVRARIQVEFEQLKVKSILNDSLTPSTVKPIFIKRDTYLSQVSLKLNNIRDDIANLQRVVYTQRSKSVYS